MALTPEQVKDVRNRYVTEMFSVDSCPYTKADLDAAIVAADAWATANATSFNQALPQPFRGASTNDQKAALLSYVATERW